MERSFDPAEFVKRVGHSLIRDFEDARGATTPGLIGSRMEQAARKRLDPLLPGGIGVGSGCVIDTRGGTSRQMDIVVYEKEACFNFDFGDNSEVTYYPVEGVMAVGEVKSRIGKKELADSFDKIRSVKALERAFEPHKREEGVYIGREYGTNRQQILTGFYRDQTNAGDVFGFILSEKSQITVGPPDPETTPDLAVRPTLVGHYVENVHQMGNDVLCPDLTVLLDGFVILPRAATDMQPYIPTRIESVLPHLIVPYQADSPFGILVEALGCRYRAGLTTTVPTEKYLKHHMKTAWMPALFVNTDRRDKTPTSHLKEARIALTRKTF